MKIFILIIFFIFVLSTNSFADSDSCGCYGNGVLAFDEAFKDSKGLYIVLWGKDFGISKKFRIELPRPHASYSQGIKCDTDKVSILTRGVPPVLNTKEITKYKMYLTEISIKDKSNSEITSDRPNHYQIWLNYTQRKIEPLNAEIPVISLPEPNLNLKDCNNREIELESNDPEHTYHLLFDDSNTESTVKDGGGIIFHRCEISLVVKNRDGKTIQKLNIANTESIETIS